MSSPDSEFGPGHISYWLRGSASPWRNEVPEDFLFIYFYFFIFYFLFYLCIFQVSFEAYVSYNARELDACEDAPDALFISQAPQKEKRKLPKLNKYRKNRTSRRTVPVMVTPTSSGNHGWVRSMVANFQLGAGRSSLQRCKSCSPSRLYT